MVRKSMSRCFPPLSYRSIRGYRRFMMSWWRRCGSLWFSFSFSDSVPCSKCNYLVCQGRLRRSEPLTDFFRASLLSWGGVSPTPRTPWGGGAKRGAGDFVPCAPGGAGGVLQTCVRIYILLLNLGSNGRLGSRLFGKKRTSGAPTTEGSSAHQDSPPGSALQ